MMPFCMCSVPIPAFCALHCVLYFVTTLYCFFAFYSVVVVITFYSTHLLPHHTTPCPSPYLIYFTTILPLTPTHFPLRTLWVLFHWFYYYIYTPSPLRYVGLRYVGSFCITALFLFTLRCYICDTFICCVTIILLFILLDIYRTRYEYAFPLRAFYWLYTFAGCPAPPSPTLLPAAFLAPWPPWHPSRLPPHRLRLRYRCRCWFYPGVYPFADVGYRKRKKRKARIFLPVARWVGFSLPVTAASYTLHYLWTVPRFAFIYLFPVVLHEEGCRYLVVAVHAYGTCYRVWTSW